MACSVEPPESMELHSLSMRTMIKVIIPHILGVARLSIAKARKFENILEYGHCMVSLQCENGNVAMKVDLSVIVYSVD